MRRTPLYDLLGIEYPIFQAGMGDILPAGEIVRRIVADAEQALEQSGRLVS